MKFTASWIWKDSAFSHDKQSLFLRRTFPLETTEKIVVRISADSRYKLYVNGRYVLAGPLKGDRFRKYYDEVDLTPYLHTGNNVVAAHVLRFPPDYLGATAFHTGAVSLVNASRGGFLLDCPACPAMNTSTQWKWFDDASYRFVEACESKYAGDQEAFDGRLYEAGWQEAGYDDSGWKTCTAVCPCGDARLGGVLYEWQLTRRDIPLLYEMPQRPAGIAKSSGADFVPLLHGATVVIPAHGTAFADVDMGALTNAFVRIGIRSPQEGARLTLTYGEAYYSFGADGCPYKGQRDNARTGDIRGEKDEVLVGAGSLVYEPFWFRVFRYMRLEITAGSTPVEITGLSFRQTGYPLRMDGAFSAGDPAVQGMWDISVRTLRRCMLDTYVDCPYYEQMQYVMDTVLEMLMTYQLSGDDALARKALYDFHSTLRPDGMIACNAPAAFDQIIPLFSLYFLDGVYYHYLYHGDRRLVADYLPTMQRILQYFDDRLDPDTGLVGDTGYWRFVDWVDEWQPNHGSPVTDEEEKLYLYSEVYAYALSRFVFLCRELGMHDLAALYRRRYTAVTAAVNAAAWDPHAGYYRLHERERTFSQHAQLWAVLSGCITGEAAADLMRRCIRDEALLPCSYSMSFYLFRACEAAGIYDEFTEKWAPWRRLMELHVTTWPEDTLAQRSDCHAWSAVPLYEFTAAVLGVQPARPGFEEIRICPGSPELGDIAATIPTPKGPVTVIRTVYPGADGPAMRLEVRLPAAIPTLVQFPGTAGERFCAKAFTVESGTRVLPSASGI